jgi:hypothetical protein
MWMLWGRVGRAASKEMEVRLTGESHRWMYDRHSLRRALEATGFAEVRICEAGTSSIEGWDSLGLDTDDEGHARKPDSLFMEARRPG